MNFDWIFNLLSNFLTPYFDKFKAKNAGVAAIIGLVLGALMYVANTGSEWGLFELNSIWQDVLQVVSFLATVFMGSRTTTIMRKLKQDKQLEQASKAA